MLYPVVFVNNDLNPTAVLLLPVDAFVTPPYIELYPTAVLFDPLVLKAIELVPIAVLSAPLVFQYNDWYPTATPLLAVVLLSNV